MLNRGKAAVVFPGQGSQRFGMGRDFLEAYRESASIFERASRALDLDMSELCFSENERLNLTEFTQPAILTAELSMYYALESKFGFKPSYFAGHSLGEYTALVAAGALQFEDAVQIVRTRGGLMQKAVPAGLGGMAAVIGPIGNESLCDLIKDSGAEIANYNSPLQLVITGKVLNLREATQRVETARPDLKVVLLNVSAPFHSSLMNEIEEEFAECLRYFHGGFSPNKAAAVLSNFTGLFHSPDTLIHNLVRQISAPVRWLANMHELTSATSDIVEVGPQPILNPFFSSIGHSIKSIYDLRTVKRTFPNETRP